MGRCQHGDGGNKEPGPLVSNVSKWIAEQEANDQHGEDTLRFWQGPALAHYSIPDVNAGRSCDSDDDHDTHPNPPTEAAKQGDGAVNEGDERRTDGP